MGERSLQAIMLPLALILLLSSCTTNGYSVVMEGDICSDFNGRKLFMDINESSVITATNITTGEAQVNETTMHHHKCAFNIKTCSACHFIVRFDYINIPRCGRNDICRCDYVTIHESPYEKFKEEFCDFSSNGTVWFMSQTRTLDVAFHFSHFHADPFRLVIYTRRNQHTMNSSLTCDDPSPPGIITSPFFPMYYPEDYRVEYVFQSRQPGGRVQLVFSDFLLSTWASIEILDLRSGKRAIFSGNVLRPPVIQSDGPVLLMRFVAGGEAGLGFKLQYNFLECGAQEHMQQIDSDCGGVVDNFGGTIKMLNMVPDGKYRLYDCVWIIKPPQTYGYKTHLSLKVTRLYEMGAKSSLLIHQGITSESYMVENITLEKRLDLQPEHISSIHQGYYIRLQGNFTNSSQLAIVYVAFSYMVDCYAVSDFRCNNQRCIPADLRCDEFDHCGDNSDELPACHGDISVHPDQFDWWFAHQTPNYFFPKSYSIDTKMTLTSITLLSCTFGAIVIILVMMSIMFRMSVRSEREERIRQQQILQDTINRLESETSEQAPELDDPPEYEEPPEYDVAIKFNIINENTPVRVKKTYLHVTSRSNDGNEETFGGNGNNEGADITAETAEESGYSRVIHDESGCATPTRSDSEQVTPSSSVHMKRKRKSPRSSPRHPRSRQNTPKLRRQAPPLPPSYEQVLIESRRNSVLSTMSADSSWSADSFDVNIAMPESYQINTQAVIKRLQTIESMNELGDAASLPVPIIITSDDSTVPQEPSEADTVCEEQVAPKVTITPILTPSPYSTLKPKQFEMFLNHCQCQGACSCPSVSGESCVKPNDMIRYLESISCQSEDVKFPPMKPLGVDEWIPKETRNATKTITRTPSPFPIVINPNPTFQESPIVRPHSMSIEGDNSIAKGMTEEHRRNSLPNLRQMMNCSLDIYFSQSALNGNEGKASFLETVFETVERESRSTTPNASLRSLMRSLSDCTYASNSTLSNLEQSSSHSSPGRCQRDFCQEETLYVDSDDGFSVETDQPTIEFHLAEPISESPLQCVNRSLVNDSESEMPTSLTSEEIMMCIDAFDSCIEGLDGSG